MPNNKSLLIKKIYSNFNKAFEKCPDAVTLTHNGVIVDCNDALVTMLGASSKKDFLPIAPSKISPLLQPDGTSSKTKALKLVQRAFSQGVHNFRWVHKRLNNQNFPCDVNLINIYDDGVDQILYAIMKDLTKEEKSLAAKKQAEKESHKSLTRERQAIKNQSEFLASMSHEIRTHMNGILGIVDLLNEGDLNENQVELLDVMRTCGDGLIIILNDILDLSKLGSDQFELESFSFDMKKCISDIAYLFFHQSSKKKTKLTTSIDQITPQYLIGDLTRIRQILINLLSNAVKFTEKGNISLRAISKQLPKKNLYQVKFIVEDDGIGISPENQKKLFRAFSQGDKTIARRFGGTGLGLVIISKLLDLMDGKIEFESALGKGTKITVTINLKKGQSDDNAFVDEHANTVHNKSDSRILIVEDNIINQKILALTLDKLGHAYDTVTNGNEALQALEKTQYSLILMDLQMPEMDGLQTTGKIIEKFGDNRPYIIAVTANAYREDRDLCINAGMNDYLSKPINMNKLKRILLTYIK